MSKTESEIVSKAESEIVSKAETKIDSIPSVSGSVISPDPILTSDPKPKSKTDAKTGNESAAVDKSSVVSESSVVGESVSVKGAILSGSSAPVSVSVSVPVPEPVSLVGIDGTKKSFVLIYGELEDLDRILRLRHIGNLSYANYLNLSAENKDHEKALNKVNKEKSELQIFAVAKSELITILDILKDK
jgi:hypothetical protein